MTKSIKPKLEDCGIIITEGVSDDDKYSLTIQKFGTKPCLCVHKCNKADGWHWSTMNEKSLVTAINIDTLKRVVNEIEERKYLFEN